MNFRLHRGVLAVMLCGCSLAACSRQDAAQASTPEAPAASQGPTDDPCALVSDGEVRQAFPGAKPGVRDHKLDQYKIASCTWDTTASTFIAQIYSVKGSLENEMHGRMLGSLDPLKRGADAKVRYEKIAGIADEAMVVVEKADAEQGILGDVAVFGMRRGERIVVLFNSNLLDGDRAATLKALEKLGRAAGTRL